MATRIKSVKVAFGSLAIYVTPTGLKTNARGKVQPTSSVLGTLSKGEARRLRKTLRKSGFPNHASSPRAV